jgi:hypothetical protein
MMLSCVSGSVSGLLRRSRATLSTAYPAVGRVARCGPPRYHWAEELS